MEAKEELRKKYAAATGGKDFPRKAGGRLAEQLRRLEAYRRAACIFVTPADILAQVRINCLADGKLLLMPGPGLKEGFFLCRPYTIPFRDLPYAVTCKGLAKFGKRLDMRALSGLGVDLMLTDALAIDRDGGRLGDGQGFFDLAHAILSRLGAVTEGTTLLAALGEERLAGAGLPLEPWDVKMDGIITPEGGRFFEGERPAAPAIFWDTLTGSRIRKITPLWKLHQAEERQSGRE